MRIGFPQFFSSRPEQQADLFARARSPLPQALADDDPDDPLFTGGPPTKLQVFFGLIRPGKPNTPLRVAIIVGVGWLPLLVLTALQSAALGDGSLSEFLTDYGVQARSLLALPLFLGAEAICLARLSAVGRYIRTSGLIGPFDAPAFSHIVRSTHRLQDSTRLEVAVVGVALSLVLTLTLTMPANLLPQWFWIVRDGQRMISPAGWWHDFVSVPLLMILQVGWLWRLFVWTRFLYLVSRLPLRLVAAHPDKAGGLKFVGMSVRAFAPVAFAISVIVAGTVANRIMHDHASPLAFKYAVAGFAVLMMALFVSPLFVFINPLVTASRRGMYDYGALARGLGQQMERRWLGHGVDAEALDANDFSATTDLYAIVTNVYAMNAVPVSLQNLVMLLLATLLPFVPVLLMAFSPQVVLQELMKLLL